MTRRGRPPSTDLPTLYDYRRPLALVQALAVGDEDSILALCKAWNVARVEDRSEPPYRGRYYTNVWSTIVALAEAALDHARQQPGGEG